LARLLLHAIQNKKLFLSPEQKKELLGPYVEKLSLEQVNQAFTKAWKPDHRLVLVTGNADIAPWGSFSAEDKIRNAYMKSRRQPADLFEPMESKTFPYLPVPDTPARIAQEQKNVNDLGITVIDLDNDIRLNLKHTDFQKEQVLFKVVFGRGRACQPMDVPGLSHISQQTVRLSGLGAMNPDQLKEALAGRDVSISFTVEDAYFSLEGTADPEEIGLVFQLIYAHFFDPGFRPEGLELAKTQYRQMYDALKRTPDGIMRIHGNRFLASGNPLFGMAHPDDVDQITLKDIRSWLAPNFAKNAIEISMVGDVKADTVISQALTHLGGFEAKRNAEPICTPAPVLFSKGEELTLSPDTKIDKGVLRIAFLTDDFWDIQQTRKLSLLSKVISERLRKIIREKLGTVYSPYVFNHPSMAHEGYGVMQMVVPVSEENRELVEQTMRDIVTDIVLNGITPREVELALNPVLSQLKDLKQTNTYWLHSVMTDSWNHPEKLQWAKTIIPAYASITSEDLGEMAKKYLDLNTSAIIRILPEN
ncbi:MAG: insulinase family protein, partial [Desulfobacteraceae bacterium]|nr:insulinase family protein [Desulfobacteraceae bacterium]